MMPREKGKTSIEGKTTDVEDNSVDKSRETSTMKMRWSLTHSIDKGDIYVEASSSPSSHDLQAVN